MRAERRIAAVLGALFAVTVLAGCAGQGASGGAMPAARGTPAADAPARAPQARNAAAPADAVAGVLAARRRGDFPELELVESGFTITEQVRIGNDARSDYETAVSLLRQNHLEQGIALLEELTASTPDATAGWIDLGIAYGAAGDLEQAEEALTAAARLSPDHPIVHNELGIVFRRSGRFAEARASYERALAVFADFHYARRNLAVLCDLYLGDLDCALANYRAYLASAGRDAEVEIWIADLENRLGI